MELISKDDAVAVAMYSKEPLEGIKNLPTVDSVEVVHGRWISQDAGLTRFKCSCCEKGNFGGHENYCPNCGAKMDLEV